MRGAVTVGVLALVLGVAGCSSGDDDGGGSGKPSGAPSVSRPAALSVPEALDAYETAAAPGCATAAECQALVTAKLKAAVDVRTAMQAKDRALYAEPIGFVNLAEQRADHYGRDNLGAKGNSFAVSQPLQQMVAWFREHPGQ